MLTLLLLVPTCLCFYLPGVGPQNYKENDNVPVFVNALSSPNTVIPFDFYHSTVHSLTQNNFISVNQKTDQKKLPNPWEARCLEIAFPRHRSNLKCLLMSHAKSYVDRQYPKMTLCLWMTWLRRITWLILWSMDFPPREKNKTDEPRKYCTMLDLNTVLLKYGYFY